MCSWNILHNILRYIPTSTVIVICHVCLFIPNWFRDYEALISMTVTFRLILKRIDTLQAKLLLVMMLLGGGKGGTSSVPSLLECIVDFHKTESVFGHIVPLMKIRNGKIN